MKRAGAVRWATALLAALVACPPAFAAASRAELEQRVAELERLVNNQGLFELSRQVQTLEAELRSMRGALEELQHAQSQAGSQQRAQYLDLDQRLQAAEQALAGLAARTEAARPAPTVDPAAEYQSAFERLKSGDYAAAGSAFEAFLAAHPGHELAPNARYWLGEVGYVERDYALALASFERVLADYPTSRKVPDALLKAAYSLQGLKRPGEARSMLARLAAEYPDTPAGREAATRLAQQDDPGR